MLKGGTEYYPVIMRRFDAATSARQLFEDIESKVGAGHLLCVPVDSLGLEHIFGDVGLGVLSDHDLFAFVTSKGWTAIQNLPAVESARIIDWQERDLYYFAVSSPAGLDHFVDSLHCMLAEHLIEMEAEVVLVDGGGFWVRATARCAELIAQHDAVTLAERWR